MLRKILIVSGSLVILAALGLLVVYLITMPEGPDPDSDSALWLKPGPYKVGTDDRLFIDPNRYTQANNDFDGSGSRALHTTVWYPQGHEGSLPLIIHSHGFVSGREDLGYVAEHLASYGYVVAAPDFPLTNRRAPGGPLVDDVVSQPGDVSYLINSLLDLQGDDKPFPGTLDQERIGVMGLSLGGLTSTLVTFHPQWRDGRIKAAVSVAGPASFFTRRFFSHADTPFLMIGGTADAIVPFDENAAPVTRRAPSGSLLTIEGGSHLGFAALSEPWMRMRDNPDVLGCEIVLGNLQGEPNEAAFKLLGDTSIGVYVSSDGPSVCEGELRKAVHPGRQLMITRLAVLSFFQSLLSDDPAVRAEARSLLNDDLPRQFAETSLVHGR